MDIIKIDRSFVKKIHTDRKCNIITKAIINMAQDLGIKVVAEGIEKPEQLAYLRRLNCLAGQGYIYSRPVPLDEFKKILARKRCNPVIFREIRIKNNIEDKRKYFRLKFQQLLEADMTVIEVNDRKVKVGNTKVLIENIGPGGLCFISNIRLLVTKNVILQFTSELIDKEIKVHGYIV
ncbi:MAG TPA: EAL domain-containing protein [Clostridiaceae bacterium]|nr:EAL domain-containing protein [Clostridiaceae bacterium]